MVSSYPGAFHLHPALLCSGNAPSAFHHSPPLLPPVPDRVYQPFPGPVSATRSAAITSPEKSADLTHKASKFLFEVAEGMFQAFVSVQQGFVPGPGMIADITGSTAEFPGGIPFMVLDLVLQVADIAQLDIDLIVVVLNLCQLRSVQRSRHCLLKFGPEIR